MVYSKLYERDVPSKWQNANHCCVLPPSPLLLKHVLRCNRHHYSVNAPDLLRNFVSNSEPATPARSAAAEPAAPARAAAAEPAAPARAAAAEPAAPARAAAGEPAAAARGRLPNRLWQKYLNIGNEISKRLVYYFRVPFSVDVPLVEKVPAWTMQAPDQKLTNMFRGVRH